MSRIAHTALSIAKHPAINTKLNTSKSGSFASNNKNQTSSKVGTVVNNNKKTTGNVVNRIAHTALSIAKHPAINTKLNTSKGGSFASNNKNQTSSKVGSVVNNNKKTTGNVVKLIAHTALSIAKHPVINTKLNTSKSGSFASNNKNQTSSKVGSVVNNNKKTTGNVANLIAHAALSATKQPIISTKLNNYKAGGISKIEYVRDPISGKIISKADFQKGIATSVEIAKKNTFKPNAKVKDPITGKPIDIFTFVSDTAKRSNFNQEIAKTIEKKGDTTFSDAMSRLEAIAKIGEVIAPEKFSELKNTLGFWSQTVGGVAKFTTYTEIGIDITKGDFNSATENILKSGLDAASAILTTKIVSKIPMIPYKPIVAPITGIIVGTTGGDYILPKLKSISESLSGKIAIENKLYDDGISKEQYLHSYPAKINQQVDSIKQSMGFNQNIGLGLYINNSSFEPAKLIILGEK